LSLKYARVGFISESYKNKLRSARDKQTLSSDPEPGKYVYVADQGGGYSRGASGGRVQRPRARVRGDTYRSRRCSRYSIIFDSCSRQEGDVLRSQLPVL
jgi:hypothetical protein